MTCNVGTIERVVRIVVSLAFFGIAFLHIVSGAFAIIACILGGIAFVTAVIGFCPAWAAFGINTCGAKPVHVKTSAPGH